MLLLPPDLPHTPVLSMPVLHDRLGERLDQVPGFIRNLVMQDQEGVNGENNLAEDVQLQVRRRAISYPDGPGVLVPTEMLEHFLPVTRSRG